MSFVFATGLRSLGVVVFCYEPTAQHSTFKCSTLEARFSSSLPKSRVVLSASNLLVCDVVRQITNRRAGQRVVFASPKMSFSPPFKRTNCILYPQTVSSICTGAVQESCSSLAYFSVEFKPWLPLESDDHQHTKNICPHESTSVPRGRWMEWNYARITAVVYSCALLSDQGEQSIVLFKLRSKWQAFFVPFLCSLVLIIHPSAKHVLLSQCSWNRASNNWNCQPPSVVVLSMLYHFCNGPAARTAVMLRHFVFATVIYWISGKSRRTEWIVHRLHIKHLDWSASWCSGCRLDFPLLISWTDLVSLGEPQLPAPRRAITFNAFPPSTIGNA